MKCSLCKAEISGWAYISQDAKALCNPCSIPYMRKEIEKLRNPEQEKEQVILEMLGELSPNTRTDHRNIAIRALRALELTDVEIKLWFAGELIL